MFQVSISHDHHAHIVHIYEGELENILTLY